MNAFVWDAEKRFKKMKKFNNKSMFSVWECTKTYCEKKMTHQSTSHKERSENQTNFFFNQQIHSVRIMQHYTNF